MWSVRAFSGYLIKQIFCLIYHGGVQVSSRYDYYSKLRSDHFFFRL